MNETPQASAPVGPAPPPLLASETPSRARPWFIAHTNASTKWTLVITAVWFVAGTIGLAFGLWVHFIGQIVGGAIAEINAALWGATWVWAKIEAAPKSH